MHLVNLRWKFMLINICSFGVFDLIHLNISLSVGYIKHITIIKIRYVYYIGSVGLKYAYKYVCLMLDFDYMQAGSELEKKISTLVGLQQYQYLMLWYDVFNVIRESSHATWFSYPAYLRRQGFLQAYNFVLFQWNFTWVYSEHY